MVAHTSSACPLEQMSTARYAFGPCVWEQFGFTAVCHQRIFFCLSISTNRNGAV
jgi:hypothetical protein